MNVAVSDSASLWEPIENVIKNRSLLEPVEHMKNENLTFFILDFPYIHRMVKFDPASALFKAIGDLKDDPKSM